MESLFKNTRLSNDTLIRFFLVAISIYVLFLIRDILVLLLVAIVIASFVESGVRFLGRRGVRRTLAVSIIYTFSILAILAIFYAFVPIIFRELSGVLTAIVNYLPSTNISPESIEGANRFVTSISGSMSLSEMLSNVKNIATAFSAGFTSIIGGTFGGVLNFVLVVVMSFYLSVQERGIETFLRILTPVKYEQRVLGLWTRTQYKIGLWFQGQLLLGLIVGAITLVGLSLFGVQYAFLIAVITALAELIPFGVIFAAVPAILFGLIDGGVILGLKILLFYILLQQIENYVLGPAVVKRMVGIPPLIVLLSFLIGISLAGFWGAVLAIPVAVFVLEYLADVEKSKREKPVPAGF